MQEVQAMWDKISGYVIQYGFGFLSAILIFLIGKWLARFVSDMADKAMVKSKVNPTLASFSKTLMYYGLLTFVCIAALSKLGVQTSPFVAVIGAAGLAVGLALQGTLANFAAGVMLIFFQPFKVGEDIEAGGGAGIVKEIQIFSTILQSKDNKKIIIPNSKITGDKIVINPK